MESINPRLYDDIVRTETQLLDILKQEWDAHGYVKVKPENFRIARTVVQPLELPAVVVHIRNVQLRYYLGAVLPILEGSTYAVLPYRFQSHCGAIATGLSS